MKFLLYMDGRVVGPYLPGEISGLFGGIASGTLACTEDQASGGRPMWRKLELFPELADCVRREAPQAPAPREERAVRVPSLDILSSDDDSGIRALLWHMLSDAGHTVEFAKDGEEVFKRLAVKRYDLVILDVNMPKMNGYKVSEVIHDKFPNPPKVIIFTGRDLEKERLQFVCSGADAILRKGDSNSKLLKAIEDLFPKNVRSPAPAEAPFVPEPQPPVIEEYSPPPKPPKLQKEEFYPAASSQKASGLPGPVPVLPEGKQADLASELLCENKGIKADLREIRRMVGHMELEYTQLEKQFETQASKLIDRNNMAAQKLLSEWESLRRHVTLSGLLLLLAVLAAVLLR